MKLLRIYSGEKKNFLLNPIFKNIFLGLRNHLPGLGRKEKKEKKNEKKKMRDITCSISLQVYRVYTNI